MTTEKHTAKIWGLEMTIEANWAEASSPVVCDGQTTQYQVADFSHRPEEAMRTLLSCCAADGEGCPVDELSDDIEEEINIAVTAME